MGNITVSFIIHFTANHEEITKNKTYRDDTKLESPTQKMKHSHKMKTRPRAKLKAYSPLLPEKVINYVILAHM